MVLRQRAFYHWGTKNRRPDPLRKHAELQIGFIPSQTHTGDDDRRLRLADPIEDPVEPRRFLCIQAV
jgi:hypothetical protein